MQGLLNQLVSKGSSLVVRSGDYAVSRGPHTHSQLHRLQIALQSSSQEAGQQMQLDMAKGSTTVLAYVHALRNPDVWETGCDLLR